MSGLAPAAKVIPAVLLAFPLAYVCDEFVQHVRAGRCFWPLAGCA